MQRVKIKPKYCDSLEEQEQIYIVVEDNGDRCFIEPEKWEWPVVPIECISKDMLEPVTD